MLTICLKISCQQRVSLKHYLMYSWQKINIYQKKLSTTPCCISYQVAFRIRFNVEKKMLIQKSMRYFFSLDCTEKGLRKHGYYLIYDSRSCRWTNRWFLLSLSSLCVRACVRVESAVWVRGDGIQLQKQDHTVCSRIFQIFESFIVSLNIWDCYWLWGHISGKRVSRHPGKIQSCVLSPQL